MALHVIVGKGPVGTTTARLLSDAGEQVRVLSRSGGRTADGIEHRAVDAADAGALAAAAAGADVLYNAVNPAYHRWATDWPPVAAALLHAAERSGAVLVTMGNMYGYGRPAGVMTEATPLAATDVKGRVRAAMWADALAAHRAGRVRVTEARASDFVGPQVPADQSHLSRQVETVRRGRRAWVVGDPDVARSWAYLPDVASTLVALGSDERAWGRAWHVPTTEPRSQRQALADLAHAMGVQPPKVSGVPWAVLRTIGLGDPKMKGIVDIKHQFDQEFVSSGAGTTAVLGVRATPWAEVMTATAGSVDAGSGARQR
jgi:nucleoside-diphosphate-sugar epimerase